MPSGSRESKIARLLDSYGLVGMGSDLESQWASTHADAEPPEALRDLATYFDAAIGRTVCARLDADPPGDSAEQVHRALTVDDAQDGADTPDGDETPDRRAQAPAARTIEAAGVHDGRDSTG